MEIGKHRVLLEPIHKELEVCHNTPLRDVLIDCGVEFPCGGRGFCGNCKVKILSGNIAMDSSHKALLEKKRLGADWRLACFSRITEDVTLYVSQYQTVIQTDQTSFSIIPEEGDGIAVDLGSTTIAAQLIDLKSGCIKSVATALNPQRQYGADIISRISYALSSHDHALHLSWLVRDVIRDLIEELISGHVNEVHKIVLVGNSVMHHLFCSLDVRPLAVFPFHSSTNGMQILTPTELHWPFADNNCIIRFFPNISHFVGSDILAGIEAIQMHKRDRFQILMDLGTNGEIVVGNKEIIMCTSTAAGPAFEGINISQGMNASVGAICQVTEKNEIRVIGNTTPIGICGSGLIDVIDLFLKQGKIDSSGAVKEGKTFLALYEKIGLTDKDIREFQLAKAAICTGLEILLKELKLSLDDVEHVYITGGLGNYLDVDKAVNLGLFSQKVKGKIVKISNAALLGAKMFLFHDMESDWKIILQKSQYCALESHPQFQDLFCDNLYFPEL